MSTANTRQIVPVTSTDGSRARSAVPCTMDQQTVTGVTRASADTIKLTPVEQRFLAASPFDIFYPPVEKIRVIVVDNFPDLGKLAAMRFLEWVQAHPGGVISLPTGRTPEYFIQWVERLNSTWTTAGTQSALEEMGIDPGIAPDMKSLHFVQMDEFYPPPRTRKSFHRWVSEYYIRGFGLDPTRAITMDCDRIGLDQGQSLESVWPDMRVDLMVATRRPRTELERRQSKVLRQVHQWCQDYEDRIRGLGGIGFFLGGLGPDGHVCFNTPLSGHHSTTRLTTTNYETQAAAAEDLGGIDVSRTRPVITIGLGTITFKRDCTALIMVAGEAKARVVAAAVQGETSVDIPASALRVLPNARFYVTTGAARCLKERKLQLILKSQPIPDEHVERILVDLAVARKKRLVELSDQDVRMDNMASKILTRRPESLAHLASVVQRRLIEKLQDGSRILNNTTFLHTEPHPDDICLGLLCYVLLQGSPTNVHHFATLTSGFTSVSNSFMLGQLACLRKLLEMPQSGGFEQDGQFFPAGDRGDEVIDYLNGVATENEKMCQEAAAQRLLRNLAAVFDEIDLVGVRDRMVEVDHYLKTAQPGRKDPGYIQQLKGMCRQWEAECCWAYFFGWQASQIHHLQMGFYTGDVFTPQPTAEHARPIIKLLENVQPEVISVAFDPEGSGPDTHYKVLQAINEATQQFVRNGYRDMRVIGYRNVWDRFHPSEANLYVPVTMDNYSALNAAFLAAYGSQRAASFPSYEHEGPFCELAQKIQAKQYQVLATCLGREWFARNDSPLLRAARGMVFLREMDIQEFCRSAGRLRDVVELR